jgi:hypothetical protein
VGRSLQFILVQGNPIRRSETNHIGRINDESVILEKSSCGKVRLLSKHLFQKVSGPWPFLGDFPEKKIIGRIFIGFGF